MPIDRLQALQQAIEDSAILREEARLLRLRAARVAVPLHRLAAHGSPLRRPDRSKQPPQ